MEVEVISASVMASTPSVGFGAAILDAEGGVQRRLEGWCLVVRRLI